MKISFILLLLTSCSGFMSFGDGQPIVKELSSKKQKQKIEQLEKKREIAQKSQRNAEEEITHLNKEIHQAQLALIRKRVDEIEKQIQQIESDPQKYAYLLQMEISALFLQERELLHKMIQKEPSSLEAQMELDRILRVITEFSDSAKR